MGLIFLGSFITFIIMGITSDDYSSTLNDYYPE